MLAYAQEFHISPTQAEREIDEDASWYLRWLTERQMLHDAHKD